MTVMKSVQTTTTADTVWPCRLQMPTLPCGRDLVSAWTTGCCLKLLTQRMRSYNKTVQNDTALIPPFVSICQKLKEKNDKKPGRPGRSSANVKLKNHCVAALCRSRHGSVGAALASLICGKHAKGPTPTGAHGSIAELN